MVCYEDFQLNGQQWHPTSHGSQVTSKHTSTHTTRLIAGSAVGIKTASSSVVIFTFWTTQFKRFCAKFRGGLSLKVKI